MTPTVCDGAKKKMERWLNLWTDEITTDFFFKYSGEHRCEAESHMNFWLCYAGSGKWMNPSRLVPWACASRKVIIRPEKLQTYRQAKFCR